MAGKATVEGRVLQGVRLLERLAPLLERLRPAGCARDRAGNRRLFYDQLCSLILLTFFNPTLKTLRDLQRASGLRTVRRKLGCERTSIGSLSEALRVFDPALLGHVVQELLGRVPHAPAAGCHCWLVQQCGRVPRASPVHPPLITHHSALITSPASSPGSLRSPPFPARGEGLWRGTPAP